MIPWVLVRTVVILGSLLLLAIQDDSPPIRQCQCLACHPIPSTHTLRFSHHHSLELSSKITQDLEVHCHHRPVVAFRRIGNPVQHGTISLTSQTLVFASPSAGPRLFVATIADQADRPGVRLAGHVEADGRSSSARKLEVVRRDAAAGDTVKRAHRPRGPKGTELPRPSTHGRPWKRHRNSREPVIHTIDILQSHGELAAVSAGPCGAKRPAQRLDGCVGAAVEQSAGPDFSRPSDTPPGWKMGRQRAARVADPRRSVQDQWTAYLIRLQENLEHEQSTLLPTNNNSAVTCRPDSNRHRRPSGSVAGRGRALGRTPDLSAALDSLQKTLDTRAWNAVEDNTVLRSADNEAWNRAWELLASPEATTVAEPVSFVQLFRAVRRVPWTSRAGARHRSARLSSEIAIGKARDQWLLRLVAASGRRR